MFTGLTEDTYKFFWEIAFQNDPSFFEPNRARYKASVQKPLLALAEELAPTVREIDDRLNVRPSAVVSRIRRDTRYSKDKSPYRDHAWLGYKMPNSYVSENFMVYVGVDRETYAYGMGMYAPESALMAELRARMLAKPQKFLELVNEPAFHAKFKLEGQAFKRPRYTEVPEALISYMNMRSMSFVFSSTDLARTLQPDFFDETREAFLLMKPVYRFLMGLS